MLSLLGSLTGSGVSDLLMSEATEIMKTLFEWIGALGWKGGVARIFWVLMLVLHAPLLFRSCWELLGPEGGIGSLVSVLTLGISSVFFLLKMIGWRMTPIHPTGKRIVVYCLLGAFLHLVFFCPSLPSEKYQFTVILSLSASISVYLLMSVARWAVRKDLSRSVGRSASAALARLRGQQQLYLEQIQPLLQPIPLTVTSHRGPPFSTRA
jgi:hypothetical protein